MRLESRLGDKSGGIQGRAKDTAKVDNSALRQDAGVLYRKLRYPRGLSRSFGISDEVVSARVHARILVEIGAERVAERYRAGTARFLLRCLGDQRPTSCKSGMLAALGVAGFARR